MCLVLWIRVCSLVLICFVGLVDVLMFVYVSFVCWFYDECIQRNAKSSCDFLHLLNCAEAQGHTPHPQCLAVPARIVIAINRNDFVQDSMTLTDLPQSYWGSTSPGVSLVLSSVTSWLTSMLKIQMRCYMLLESKLACLNCFVLTRLALSWHYEAFYIFFGYYSAGQ